MATSKIDRMRKALHLGKKRKGGDDAVAVATTQTTQTLVFASENLVPLINTFSSLANPGAEQTYTLDGDLCIELTLTIDGQIATQDAKNDLFRDHVSVIAKRLLDIHGPDVRPSLDNMVEVLESMNANPDKAITQDQVSQLYAGRCAEVGRLVSDKLHAEVVRYMESNKAIKAAYRRYQIKCVHDIVMDVAVIAASIGVTAASWGATGPVAVVAIVRSTVGLGVKLGEAALSAGQTIGVIEAYFDAVGSVMTAIEKDEGKDDTIRANARSACAKNTAVEVFAGAIAGITNLPIPSISKLGELMGKLESKLKGLHVDMLDLGKAMTRTRKRAERYQARIAERAKTEPSFPSKAHEDLVKDCLSSHAAMKTAADRLFAKIVVYIGRQAEFQHQLDLYKQGQKSWSRGSSKLFGFATSLGLGLGSSGSGAEFGLAVFNEIGAFAEGKLVSKAAALG